MYNNYSFCFQYFFDDYIEIDGCDGSSICNIISQVKENRWIMNSQFSFFGMKGETYMSSYDDTFDKSQFALYDYDATNDKVKDLFNKYRMFKRNVDGQNKKLG